MKREKATTERNEGKKNCATFTFVDAIAINDDGGVARSAHDAKIKTEKLRRSRFSSETRESTTHTQNTLRRRLRKLSPNQQTRNEKIHLKIFRQFLLLHQFVSRSLFFIIFILRFSAAFCIFLSSFSSLRLLSFQLISFLLTSHFDFIFIFDRSVFLFHALIRSKSETEWFTSKIETLLKKIL